MNGIHYEVARCGAFSTSYSDTYWAQIPSPYIAWNKSLLEKKIKEIEEDHELDGKICLMSERANSQKEREPKIGHGTSWSVGSDVTTEPCGQGRIT